MSQESKVIENTIAVIRETTELFYQQKTKEAYAKMQDTLTCIVQVVDTLHEYKCANEDFGLEETRIAASLTDAMNAMEAGDTVLLADILEYDFIEYLQELLSQMG